MRVSEGDDGACGRHTCDVACISEGGINAIVANILDRLLHNGELFMNGAILALACIRVESKIGSFLLEKKMSMNVSYELR
jgi:hypothetical protein